jgi:hypothetical protein
MSIRPEKRLRLGLPAFVQVRIHTTTLHNILQIVVGLPVADQVNGLRAQILRVFGRKYSKKQSECESGSE